MHLQLKIGFDNLCHDPVSVRGDFVSEIRFGFENNLMPIPGRFHVLFSRTCFTISAEDISRSFILFVFIVPCLHKHLCTGK